MLDKLQSLISTSEGKLCGAILQKPTLLLDYTINKNYLGDAALLFVTLAEKLLSRGVEVIDEISIETEVENIGGIIEGKYKRCGGYQTVRELMSVVDASNIEFILDEWNKYQIVKKFNQAGIFDIEKNWDKVVGMSAEQISDYIEYQINHIDIDVCSDIVFETLSFTDKELQDIQEGINQGIPYNKHSPYLNYLTNGIAKSNVYLFGGYTNSGKSSFIFENMICDIVEQKKKCCVISNEQKSDAFKVLLLVHVLTQRLNYKKLDRKKIKAGKYTSEDLLMINEARKIIREEYDPYLQFVKLFDYNTASVNKIVKKLSKVGFECFFYDTFKVSEGGDGQTWEKLLKDSKDLFQIASKNDVALILSVQLALHSKNKTRWLDEGVLSNGKQIAETVETGVYMRDIWNDEWKGETYDIRPYVLKKDSNGRYTNEREDVELDRNKKYKLMFLSKCRSDENGQVLVYEFDGRYNRWKEIARCTPHTKNLY